MTKVTTLLHPQSSAEVSDSQPFLDPVEHPDGNIAPGDAIFLLFQTPTGTEYDHGVASDGQSLTNKGDVQREQLQAGLELTNNTREIALTYRPTGTPKVIFFGRTLNLDISKLRGGVVSPLKYDGEPIKFNVTYQAEFKQLKHTPAHPTLVDTDLGGILHEDYRGQGDHASWPVVYEITYG